MLTQNVNILISHWLFYIMLLLHMNELDAIQQQMAALGIDVSPDQTQDQAPAYEDVNITDEDMAMFQPG
jgi:hypothetical protein